MNVVFFDGECGLCHAWVGWLIRQDTQKLLHFAPLQSSYAKDVLPQEFRNGFSSVVLLQEGHVYTRSTAILKMLQLLGGMWKSAKVFSIFPCALRDKVYDFVAKNRYALVKKSEKCRIPTEEEKGRFLS